jgi:hypothetical protein
MQRSGIRRKTPAESQGNLESTLLQDSARRRISGFALHPAYSAGIRQSRSAGLRQAQPERADEASRPRQYT